MKKPSLLAQVLIALFLAAIVGSFSTPDSQLFGIPYIQLFGFLGQLFLNALTLLVVPLVASSILHGISQMGKDETFGRLGAKTFLFYILTTFLAVLTGLLFVNLVHPGSYITMTDSYPMGNSITSAETPQTGIQAIGQVILKLVPKNIFEAASSGNMLGIVFFSILFGFASTRIEGTAFETLIKFWKGVFFTLMRMTHFFMKLMPIGVFCLVAHAIALKGFSSMESLLYFLLTVLIGLAVFMFVILPLLLKIRGINPWKHIRAMSPALITAFSTSSSAATLPITMECVERRVGVSNQICSFVIPLGTSMNMSGSALYECIAVLFIAQVSGISLTLSHQCIIAFLSLLTSLGLAGIPSGSLVAILIILNAVGLPAESLALILPVDRILDMCRTTVNVFSDSCCAALVAKSEGEEILKS